MEPVSGYRIGFGGERFDIPIGAVCDEEERSEEKKSRDYEEPVVQVRRCEKFYPDEMTLKFLGHGGSRRISSQVLDIGEYKLSQTAC